MPLLRFNMFEGRTDAEIKTLLDAAHAAVVAAFHVPEGDRYQLVSEYRPGRMIALDTGLGIARTDKVVLVEVRSRTRREDEKLRFYELLCRKLKDACNLDSSDIIVSFVENGDADWSFGLGRAQFVTGELA
ncbi:tautomerase family protein [Bradyrhizobium sp. KB893862 SZCCT0404]|uniref:tautomerase family protein n=1 Tax=Bradyrhizobium sp. KB893862 SZCCT0404 TaxID=2807672 RepID=UPI001BA53A77|nr:tautomerase family protein [Bradyrhizobium sp. KB893862 SZCCT0404]MBR1179286.1 tautomerase family protein [Bradyrhizobium sp. KB893862 SZCCT0404]